MPCYRCGTRQVDPERGTSPWRRGVRTDRQVLICPDCQGTADWTADLDRCPECSSVHLVRRLGEVECRDCGAVAASGVAPARVSALGDPVHADARVHAGIDGLPPRDDVLVSPAGPGSLAAPGRVPMLGSVPGRASLPVPASLADEVEEALARVFGRAARHSGNSSAGT